ncbi:MAG: nucleotide exchange factor GrpE [Slackia sp.]|nr:nucleotide exchange factor GrpE [Slackia sp.]
MAADEKNADEREAREIPIEGTEAESGSVEGASAAEAVTDAADQASADQAEGAAEEEADDIAAEAEAVVAEAERVANAEAEAAAMKDRYLRLQAEWDNYRKRTAEEAADMKVRAAEKIMEDVLPVLDDFERAIAHAEQNGEEGLLDGVKAISTKVCQVFAKHGLEPIDPAGQPFDALEHQAVATVPDESVPDETVAQVYQKGYRLGKKVLRPAMVTISSGGPKRENAEKAEEE